jgi:outer membrane lipoprotein carrier protein
MKRVIASFLLSGFAVLSHAGAMDSLENFIRTARSGHADFTQVVTEPPRNGG